MRRRKAAEEQSCRLARDQGGRGGEAEKGDESSVGPEARAKV